MATRLVLQELVRDFESSSRDTPVTVESVGGVEAARRVEAGEPFDLVVLASGAIDKLTASGRILGGSRVDLTKSPIAVAVGRGAPRPPIASEDDVRTAVLAARTIGYSTGPSGDHLVRLFERWGIADTVKTRTVQAPPGVPVGSLVATGDVSLGFQQLTELLDVEGIEVLGLLPPAIQSVTTFAAGIAATCEHRDTVQALLGFVKSPAAAATIRKHGMEPA